MNFYKIIMIAKKEAKNFSIYEVTVESPVGFGSVCYYDISNGA